MIETICDTNNFQFSCHRELWITGHAKDRRNVYAYSPSNKTVHHVISNEVKNLQNGCAILLTRCGYAQETNGNAHKRGTGCVT